MLLLKIVNKKRKNRKEEKAWGREVELAFCLIILSVSKTPSVNQNIQ